MVHGYVPIMLALMTKSHSRQSISRSRRKGIRLVVLLLVCAVQICPFRWPSAAADPRPADSADVEKPTPRDGDVVPFPPRGSATNPIAPTVAVIGDSVARDYAYYLAGAIGPRGVRVLDGAIPNCPAGTLPRIQKSRGEDVFPRGGLCPRYVATKQAALIRDFHPQLILWHSMVELYDMVDGKRRIPFISPNIDRRILAEWDETLSRISRGGATVVVILPTWYGGYVPTAQAGIAKLRTLYARWAAAHRLSLVDVTSLVCPAGPPCGPDNGQRFRPDTVHFGGAGGPLVASYLVSHVPALARLVASTHR